MNVVMVKELVLVHRWSFLHNLGWHTLIEFAKFGVETVLMGKTCNFDSNLSDFNSVDLKKVKKLSKAKFFFQRPNLKSKGQKFQIL